MVGLTIPAVDFSTRVTDASAATLVFEITSTVRDPGSVSTSVAFTVLTVTLDAVMDAGTTVSSGKSTTRVSPTAIPPFPVVNSMEICAVVWTVLGEVVTLAALMSVLATML